jgi:hypothetical protein
VPAHSPGSGRALPHTATEGARARTTGAALEARLNDDSRGQVIRDGSDPPRLVGAQKITRLAAAFGVQPRLTARSPRAFLSS